MKLSEAVWQLLEPQTGIQPQGGKVAQAAQGVRQLWEGGAACAVQRAEPREASQDRWKGQEGFAVDEQGL